MARKTELQRIAEKYKLEEWHVSLVRKLRRERPVLHTVCEHVSGSGMSRRISVYWLHEQDYHCLNSLIAATTGFTQSREHEGLVVGGCGMDMGFHVVYSFSHSIFPRGFRYRKGEGHRNGSSEARDPEGGYALTQRWL